MDANNGYAYFRHNRDCYKVQFDSSYNTIAGTLDFTENQPTGNEGKYVSYQDKPWIVLRENENTVELISALVGQNVTLGADTNNGGTLQDGKDSYNNAVTTIINACKTGLTGNVRSVGGPTSDTTTDTDSYGFKVGDENYLSDYQQMQKLGILLADVPLDYWIPSREIEVDTYTTYKIYRIRFREARIDFRADTMILTRNDGTLEYGNEEEYAVRPVITIEKTSAISSALQGEGTIANPIQIN